MNSPEYGMCGFSMQKLEGLKALLVDYKTIRGAMVKGGGHLQNPLCMILGP